jgi:putative DNA primase/helicase
MAEKDTGESYCIINDVPPVRPPDWLLELARRKSRGRDEGERNNTTDHDGDEKVIMLVLNGPQGSRFQQLMDGHVSEYPSQSEADFALCRILAVHAGNNRRTIDRIFRRSALYRKKWDEQHAADGSSYGEITIEKAIRVNEIQSQNGANLTDVGNAERLIQCHKNDLRFCHEPNKWFVWDGQRWVADGGDKVDCTP